MRIGACNWGFCCQICRLTIYNGQLHFGSILLLILSSRIEQCGLNKNPIVKKNGRFNDHHNIPDQVVPEVYAPKCRISEMLQLQQRLHSL